jgi:hypothetical protein
MPARRNTVVGAVVALLGAAGLTACDPPPPAHFVVDVATDAPDAAPYDGVCATAGGACTLRAAITESAPLGELGDQGIVQIAPGIDPVLSLGPLTTGGGLVLRGGGATIDAGGATSFLRMGGRQYDLEDLTITGAGAGGTALEHQSSGSLELRRVSIIDNGGRAITTTDTARVDVADATIARNAGGGVVADHGSVVNSTITDNGGTGLAFYGSGSHPNVVVGSTIARNTGSLALSGGQAPLTIVVSSIVDNTGHVTGDQAMTLSASLIGDNDGAVTLAGSSVVRASTITGNGSLWLGGVWGGPVTIEGSTIADNGTGHQLTGNDTLLTISGSIVDGPADVCATQDTPPDSSYFTIASGGWNVVSDESCVLDGPGDQQGVDPLLGPLVDLAGPTQVRAPGQGSPAVEAIPGGTPGLCDGSVRDQRLITRPQGPECEAGAVEYPDVP